MDANQNGRISSGIRGFDEILCGGFKKGNTYLIRGGPGTGKTTLGLHFLIEGIKKDESPLYITFEEPEDHIRKNAEIMGLNLEGIHFLDLSPASEFFSQVQSYDIFSPAEVEREPITQKIVNFVEQIKPKRIFVDPITQIRYLSTDLHQFRKQVFSFLRFLVEQGATVLFTSEISEENPDNDLQFLSDGVVNLNANMQKRSISMIKHRGSNFRAGLHSVKLSSKGMEIFPTILPGIFKKEFEYKEISFGIPAMDELSGGGLEYGTISIFSGPTGVGKTTLGAQFLSAAASKGEKAVLYTFEEEVESILHRCDSLKIPARQLIEQDTLSIVKIEPLQYSPEEFANLVRHNVEEQQVNVVMIDSISGYNLSIRGDDLIAHLHSLCKYLQSKGVITIVIIELDSIIGEFKASDIGASYLSDTIIFLRYLEIKGELRKAIGVLKKRLSNFEKTLREIEITSEGIVIGKPLSDLRGILLGTPEWIKETEPE